MAALPPWPLFQTAEGRIDARTWRQATALLGAVLGALTAIWLLLSPYAHRDLASTQFIALPTLVAFVYLLLYAFAVILIAISHYNLSAKRWRDRGWRFPGALAGLLPLAALVSGAAHWMQPRVAEVIPYAYVAGIDLLLVAIVVWNLVELGFSAEREP